MLKFFGVVLVTILLLALFLGGEPTHTGSSGTKEIELTDAMKRDVAGAIRGAGFNCPEAKIGYAKGEDSYGTVTKVYCGPKETSGVDKHAVFRLTFRPDDSIIVKPWE